MRRAKSVLSQSAILAVAVALGFVVFTHSSSSDSSSFAVATANADGKKKAKPCISKSFKFKQVEAACKEGGQKAAKKLMKAIVKKAKKAGDDNASSCLNCHDDLKTFKRTKDAAAWLKPYSKYLAGFLQPRSVARHARSPARACRGSVCFPR